jgi:hypothetical protein
VLVRRKASNVNFAASRVVSNGVVVQLGSSWDVVSLSHRPRSRGRRLLNRQVVNDANSQEPRFLSRSSFEAIGCDAGWRSAQVVL